MSEVYETLELRSCELQRITAEGEPEIWDVTWHGLTLGRIGHDVDQAGSKGKGKDKPKGKSKDKSKDKAKDKDKDEDGDARWWFRAVGDGADTPGSRSIKQALRRLIQNFQRNLANETGV